MIILSNILLEFSIKIKIYFAHLTERTTIKMEKYLKLTIVIESK